MRYPDTDVIIWEGDPCDPTRKPPEMYTLIENFCLGIRRLEVFGRASSSLRRGWVTLLGQVEEDQLYRTHGSGGAVFVDGDEGGDAFKWERESWETRIKELANGGKPVVPMTADIDALRPKSPFRPGNTGTANIGPGGNVGGGGASGGVVMGMQNSAMGPRVNGNGRGFNLGMMATPGQNQMIGAQSIPAGHMGGMNPQVLGMEIRNGMLDGMMAAWPGMIGNLAMGNMPGMNVPGMAGMGMGMGGNVGANGMANASMGDMSSMAFHGQQGGNIPMSGMSMFNPAAMNGLAWGEQGQFAIDGTWDGENAMNLNMNGLHGMNMGGSMGMGGQWGQ